MIYKLKNTYIDLSKLEYISPEKRFGSGDVLYFQYQVNSTVFTTNGDEYLERDNLIHAWKNFKEKK